MAANLARIAHAPDGSLRDVHRQADEYQAWADSEDRRDKVLVADAWCAAFVCRKHPAAPPAIVNRVFSALKEKGRNALPPPTATEVERLRDEYSFFHWHLEFPDIFRVADAGGRDTDPETGCAGGFDILLGNPPWDKLEFKEKEYFSTVEPAIAALAGQTRRNRITKWEQQNPDEGVRYRAARRRVKAVFTFAGSSRLYPKCAEGLTAPGVVSLQTDHLFAERFAGLATRSGRVGCIIPTTIATNAGAQYLFANFVRRGAVASLYDFENRGSRFFPGVHASYKFCLISLAGKSAREPVARYAFYLLDVAELDDLGRVFELTPGEIAIINPNTLTLPIFRNRRDAALATAIYGRIKVFWADGEKGGNPWGITFKHLYNMTDDSDLFHKRTELERDGWRLAGNIFARNGKRMLPLYEAKMAHYFDHRWASFRGADSDDPRRLSISEKKDPSNQVEPRYWVAEEGPIPVNRKGRDVELPGVSDLLAESKWEHGWLCGWRDVCRATDERTAIPAFIPRAAVGNKFHLMLPSAPVPFVAALIATQSSLIFDFVSRQKIGSVAMGLFIWKQLPVPAPAMLEPHLPFIVPRLLELVFTAYDMTPLARDLGEEGEPFCWDEDRRAQLRAELDAFFFRLYGIDDRDDVDYILETFQSETGGLKHNEIRDHGEYRTKRLVLAEYDRMAAADAAGVPYESPLELSPGQGPRHQVRAGAST